MSNTERAEVYRDDRGNLMHLTTCNVGWRVANNVPVDGLRCCNVIGCVCNYDGAGVPERVTDPEIIQHYWKALGDLATQAMDRG